MVRILLNGNPLSGRAAGSGRAVLSHVCHWKFRKTTEMRSLVAWKIATTFPVASESDLKMMHKEI